VKLLTKFNLVLVFGLGMLLISHDAYNFLMSDARQQAGAGAGWVDGSQRQRDQRLYRRTGQSDPGENAAAQ